MTKKQEEQFNFYVKKKLEKTRKKEITIKYTIEELIQEIPNIDINKRVEILKQIDPNNYEDILELLEIKFVSKDTQLQDTNFKE